MEWDSAKYDMRKLKEQYGIQSKEEKKMRVNYVKAYLMNPVDDEVMVKMAKSYEFLL